ncbi:class IV adenylate cyclase [Amycolatopsis cynarae]|uniref:Class IV adenylate cyclase n=1 Tax=Amycolatopsis cynarae TaxID=2995223 RepID=A0ABY7B2L2_9PSEU|nr:class IV adenylate cyclase [Amycolatopsis sp. HUAS 11-8]WAL66456.1 class IV adenylate cyclase [Amycolatopsis sp. HUAS 11-8]
MSTFQTEVERKRELNGDIGAVKARVTRCGYLELGTSVEVDAYYSRPDRDFLATVECLRVRQRDGFAEITYKPSSTAETHSSEDIIAKRETNVVLAGDDQATVANDLLAVLGMVPLCEVRKTRTTYRHPGRSEITVAFDAVAGVGDFLETEVLAENVDEASRLLDEVERQLGLTGYAIVKLPYRDLVLRHQ